MLRFGAIGYLIGAELEWLVFINAEASTQMVVFGLTSLLASMVVFVPVVREPPHDWLYPVITLSALTSVACLFIAIEQSIDRPLTSTALLITAASSAAAGIALKRLTLRIFAVALSCTAWLVYASISLTDNPQWFTVPTGLTMLVIVEMIRSDLPRDKPNSARLFVVPLEFIGVVILVAASFVQSITDSLAYAALAMGLGVLIIGWGLLTKVRRRLTTGAVVVVLGLLTLVGIPLSQLIPAWTGAALWISIAVIGLVAIVGATMLEQGRAAVRRGITSFRAMTDGWE
jgi:hypothetical protein